MATFEIIEGAPGQGKSLYTARIARKLIDRNHKWFEKSGIVRPVFSNIKFSEEFENHANGTMQNYPDFQFLKYWDNPIDLCEVRDVDVLWDEVATELDARNFANLPDELKRFLSQYRKRGVDIYANTQDFSMVDARARLMVSRVATLTKIIGSPDPSPTKPPVKRIWGLVMIREVENFKAYDPQKKDYGLVPSFFLIDREDVSIYDTRQDITPGSLPVRKLRKELQVCEEDGFERVRYI